MRKNKHIAVACNYELKPSRIGGMDRFFKAYNDSLVKEGYNVTWFFSKGQPMDFYSGIDLQLGQGGAVEELLLEFLEQQKGFDVVVTHFVALCTPFFQQLKKKGVGKIIAVDHNPRPLNGFPLKKRLKNRIKSRLYSHYIDHFVGVSQYTVDCILEDYGNRLRKKTSVIYNGIEHSVYSKKQERNTGKFIVASHLRPSKGIQDLIEAVGLLSEEVKAQLQIDVFGEGPIEQQLKEKVRSYGLEQQFRLKGSSPELPQLFRNYSYLLQPTYMECFSLSILESLAANVPVITTPVGGNPEVIRDGVNGLLFQPGDTTHLATLLQEVIEGKKEILEDVSLEIEENYSLEKMLEGHLKLLSCI